MTPTEKTVLKWTARGKSNAEIAEHLDTSLANVHIYRSRLKKYLGFKLTEESAKAWMYGKGSLLLLAKNVKKSKTLPTNAQMRAMLMFAQNLSIEQIAKDLQIKPQTVSNAICQGCITAGVHRRGLRSYFEKLGHLLPEPPPADPWEGL